MRRSVRRRKHAGGAAVAGGSEGIATTAVRCTRLAPRLMSNIVDGATSPSVDFRIFFLILFCFIFYFIFILFFFFRLQPQHVELLIKNQCVIQGYI